MRRDLQDERVSVRTVLVARRHALPGSWRAPGARAWRAVGVLQNCLVVLGQEETPRRPAAAMDVNSCLDATRLGRFAELALRRAVWRG